MDATREAGIKTRYEAVAVTADERTLRRLAGAEAMAIGRGGVRAVVRATGMSPNTVRAGIAELEGKTPALEPGRQRRTGGGRKRAEEKDPTLRDDLNLLIEPVTRGDPEGPLRWTSKSVRRLSTELKAQGHKEASPSLIADLLGESGYSLQANSKTIEGSENPDRDAQFRFIADSVTEFQTDGDPAISVDAKKKELVGDFKNAGRELRPKGNPEKVRVYDFVLAEGRATPYGIYDITHNEGWVSVGIDHDTAAFAVHSIGQWWWSMGVHAYPHATKLLITADGGGSNASRSRLWKMELARLATEIQLPIVVSHFPPGTSKWNKIEHRLFSHISMNWRGKPLVDHQTIVNLIGATTSRTGLKVRAALDISKYPVGIRIPKVAVEEIIMDYEEFHPEWNYTIYPQAI
jgi:hypothetical protein